MQPILVGEISLLPATVQQLQALAKDSAEFEALTGIQVEPGSLTFGAAPLLFVAQQLQNHPNEAGWWTWLPVLVSENKLIGTFGFKGLPNAEGEVEIGYELAPSYRGRGLATQMAAALARHAFLQTGVRSVLAHTLAENNASVAVLRKIGMVFQGEMEDEGMKVWKWKLNPPAEVLGTFIDSRKTDYLLGHESKRLQMRPLRWEDAIAWEEFLGHAEATRFLPLGFDETRLAAQSWLHKQLGRYACGTFGMQALIDKESDEFIGQCGLLMQVVEGKHELEVGYHIFPQHWRKGFASEAAKAWMDWADQRQIGKDIISLIHIDNVGSQGVALKNGLKVEKQVQMMGLDILVFRR